MPPAQALALAEQQRRAGRFAPAENLCLQVLLDQPRNGEAFHLLGIIAHQTGRTGAAIDLVRRAIEVEGSVALYHCNLGEMYRLTGRLDEAVAAAERALALKPDYPQALNNLGIAHFEREEYERALACYDRALRLSPDLPEAHSNRGNVLRAQKKLPEAIAAYARALALKPAHADALNNLGAALRDQKKPKDAEAAYRKALALKPQNPTILCNLALALMDQQRHDEALAILSQTLGPDPDNHKAHAYTAAILLKQGKLANARASARRALALRADDPEALNVMGQTLFEENHPEEALGHLRKAVALNPDFADAHNNLGNAFTSLGEIEAAAKAFERAVEIEPDLTGAILNLAEAKNFAPGDPHLAAMEKLAADPGVRNESDQAQLDFALAKAYADLGRHEDSFRHLHNGNRLKRRQIVYDERATAALFDRIAATFTLELMLERQGLGDPSPLPIFILGMPRSGSTLVEQILASHPKVFAAGEVRDLEAVLQSVRLDGGGVARYPEFVPALGSAQLRQFGERYLGRLRAYSARAKRITNKMPANFFYAGLLQLVLPNARIIHTRRDPVDTCFSCFSKLFSGEQNFTYDLGELGRYYRRYEGLMAHWRRLLPAGAMLEVTYEALVGDFEASARRIIAYCGLEWDEACLEFYKAKRGIKTASAAQVRRPVYREAVGRSRPYRHLLEPLLRELAPVEPAEGPTRLRTEAFDGGGRR